LFTLLLLARGCLATPGYGRGEIAEVRHRKRSGSGSSLDAEQAKTPLMTGI